MIDLEIPLGKRSKTYRFFEMVPAIISYGMIILMVVFSMINPLIAAVYLLVIIITMLVKAAGIAVQTVGGHRRLVRAQRVDWHARLLDLEDPQSSYERIEDERSSGFGYHDHQENVRLLASQSEQEFRPSDVYHAVIIATHNESFEVLDPTVQSVVDTTYDKKRMIIVIAYEGRGGQATEATVKRLQQKYKDKFYAFEIVKHPENLPNEITGKGPNITFAGKYLQTVLDTMNIAYKDVIVTTLDSDNRPYTTYFDYVAYEYVVRDNRQHLSYQPISLFLSNIWDAPAPMRVIATGNSFWNIISAMRPHTLRNFASHSQPMEALVGMGFWSTRTIVEDGHQYWRSYFYFNGAYDVVPIYVPIYQDAVLSDTYIKTLKEQFTQLRRWAYGASDIPYVAVRVLSRRRNVPFLQGIARLARLIDGHVTLAVIAILVTFGGWIPLFINNQAARDIAAHQLPQVISLIQRIAMIGIFITVLLSIRMLPPRPARYKRRRTVWMVAQWVLMPVTSICYSALAAFNAQTHLFLGKYLDKFDATVKATVVTLDRAKQTKEDIKKND